MRSPSRFLYAIYVIKLTCLCPEVQLKIHCFLYPSQSVTGNSDLN